LSSSLRSQLAPLKLFALVHNPTDVVSKLAAMTSNLTNVYLECLGGLSRAPFLNANTILVLS
jgi:hypothetical protein